MDYLRLKGIKKLYFGYEDVAKSLGVTLDSAKVTSSRMVDKGIFVRLKRNIYILKDRWDNLNTEDRFLLANIIQTPSYISLMTALDYYGITTQMQRNFVESIGILRTKGLVIHGFVLKYSKVRKGLYFGFRKEGEFFIATPEKAFLDAFYLMSLKRYSFDLTSINFDRLDFKEIRQMLKVYPKKTQGLMGDKYGYFRKT